MRPALRIGQRPGALHRVGGALHQLPLHLERRERGAQLMGSVRNEGTLRGPCRRQALQEIVEGAHQRHGLLRCTRLREGREGGGGPGRDLACETVQGRQRAADDAPRQQRQQGQHQQHRCERPQCRRQRVLLPRPHGLGHLDHDPCQVRGVDAPLAIRGPNGRIAQLGNLGQAAVGPGKVQPRAISVPDLNEEVEVLDAGTRHRAAAGKAIAQGECDLPEVIVGDGIDLLAHRPVHHDGGGERDHRNRCEERHQKVSPDRLHVRLGTT